MLGVLLQRTVLRAPTTLGRVGVSMLARPTRLTAPWASRTFLTSPTTAEPASTATEPAGKTASTKAASTKTKAGSAGKKTASAKTKAASPKKTGKTKKPAKKAAKKPAAKGAAPKKAAKRKIVDISGHTPPKRALTSFLYFLEEKREALGNKIASVTEARLFMTENSAAWKALSDAEKQPYVDRAKAGQVEYKIRRDEYLKTVPRKVLTEINRQRRKRGHQKIRGIGPTRPLQPFMRFSQDIRDEFLAAYTGPPRNAVPASAAAAGIRWRNMSDADKAPYVEAFNREKEAIEAQKEAAVDAS